MGTELGIAAADINGRRSRRQRRQRRPAAAEYQCGGYGTGGPGFLRFTGLRAAPAEFLDAVAVRATDGRPCRRLSPDVGQFLPK